MKKWLLLALTLGLALTLCLPALAEQTILYASRDLLIRVLDVEISETGAPGMEIWLTNNSDKTLSIGLDDCTVDGYACDPHWGDWLEPGESSEGYMVWDGMTGIPTQITFLLYAFDVNDLDADYLLHQTFTLYPQGEENVRLLTYERKKTDVVLVDTEEITALLTGYDPYLCTMQLHLENRTDRAISFEVDRIVADGGAVNIRDYAVLPPHSMLDVPVSLAPLPELPSKLRFRLSAYERDDLFAPALSITEHTVQPRREAMPPVDPYVPAETDVVLVDTQDLLVVCTGFEQEDDVSMLLYLENRSDQNLTFTTEECVVEGVTSDPVWYADLPAHSAARQKITWDTLGEIPTAVHFLLHAYDSDAWNDVLRQPVALYPLGEENAHYITYTPIESDLLLVDTEDLAIWVVNYSVDDFWGVSMSLIVENRGENTLVISMPVCTLDGKASAPLFFSSAPAKSITLTDVMWLDVTELPTELVFTLSVYDGKAQTETESLLGPFTVNPTVK